MCKCNTFEKGCLKVVKVGIFVIAIALLVVIIIMMITQVCSMNFCELIQSPRMLHYAIIALFSLITLFVAIVTLNRSVSAEEMKAIVALRELFYQKTNLNVNQAIKERQNFFPESEEETRKNVVENKHEKQMEQIQLFQSDTERICALNNYLGTLEVAYLMVEKGVINMKEFDNLFGYRLTAFFNNKSIADYVSKRPDSNAIIFRAKEALDTYHCNKLK